MIYVEEESSDRQIELISFVATTIDCNICAWFYPESLATEIAGFSESNNSEGLVPVTKYENGFIPRNTSLVPANKESIGRFAGATAELKKNCDSVTLYKNGKSSWLLATIGHEGMCILQDNTLLTSLVKAGYKASNEAPSWW